MRTIVIASSGHYFYRAFRESVLVAVIPAKAGIHPSTNSQAD